MKFAATFFVIAGFAFIFAWWHSGDRADWGESETCAMWGMAYLCFGLASAAGNLKQSSKQSNKRSSAE